MIMMNLNETVELMNSSNYKDRFKAEYYQLIIRTKKLFDVIVKYKNGTLDFKPTCPIEVLTHQLAHMMQYEEILRHRAELENIDLDDPDAINHGELFVRGESYSYIGNKGEE